MIENREFFVEIIYWLSKGMHCNVYDVGTYTQP